MYLNDVITFKSREPAQVEGWPYWSTFTWNKLIGGSRTPSDSQGRDIMKLSVYAYYINGTHVHIDRLVQETPLFSTTITRLSCTNPSIWFDLHHCKFGQSTNMVEYLCNTTRILMRKQATTYYIFMYTAQYAKVDLDLGYLSQNVWHHTCCGIFVE